MPSDRFPHRPTQRPSSAKAACRPTIAFLKSDRSNDPTADERNGDQAQLRGRSVLTAGEQADAHEGAVGVSAAPSVSS